MLACRARLERLLPLAQSRLPASSPFPVDLVVAPSEHMGAQLQGRRDQRGRVRLVFSRPMVDNLTDAELLSVMGHELGHLHLGHLWNQHSRGLALAWGISSLLTALAFVTACLGGCALVPACLAAGMVGMLLLLLVRRWATKVVMGLHEFQADRCSVGVAGARASVSALRKTAQDLSGSNESGPARWRLGLELPSYRVRIGQIYRHRHQLAPRHRASVLV